MFGRRKTKRNKPEIDSGRLEEVIQRFGTVIEETHPGHLYDVSKLPFAKEEILSCLLAAFALTVDEAMRSHLEVAVVSLAQFQEGVGAHPISELPIDTTALLKAHEDGDLSITEMATKISEAGATIDKEKLNRIREAERAETEKYLTLIRAARWTA